MSNLISFRKVTLGRLTRKGISCFYRQRPAHEVKLQVHESYRPIAKDDNIDVAKEAMMIVLWSFIDKSFKNAPEARPSTEKKSWICWWWKLSRWSSFWKSTSFSLFTSGPRNSTVTEFWKWLTQRYLKFHLRWFSNNTSLLNSYKGKTHIKKIMIANICLNV